jgi:hypothetical protein
MRHGGGFRFLAALFFMGFVGLFTLGAFAVGVAVGAGSTGAAFTGWGPGWGHGSLIGLLLTILIFLILLRMIGFVIFGHHRRPWARHGYFHGGFDRDRFGPGGFGPGGSGDPDFGRGGWHRGDWREAGQPYFDEFHRRAHGTETPGPGTIPGAAPENDQPR